MSTNVLFVCLGNICRSPTAHGIFQHKVKAAGLSDTIKVDSAGTSGWHIGSPPDERSAAAALQRGYDLSGLRGRKVEHRDFQEYDYILAMDINNLNDLQEMAPPDYFGTLDLFLKYASQKEHLEVPDPYYGGDSGFELVINLVEDACEGLLSHIQSQVV